jgi:hypothetical protein
LRANVRNLCYPEDEDLSMTSVLPHAPAELTHGRLRRIGEGIGKVVYASDHWVVKRQRSPSEILALIAIWKIVRKAEGILPGTIGQRLLAAPSRQLRLLRVFMQGVLAMIPKSIWYMTHLRDLWHVYTSRAHHGERLAQELLHGSSLVPELISFPPVRVEVGGWPGYLTVDHATERVEATLLDRLNSLAAAGAWDAVEWWLDCFLETRQTAWRRGIFSVDAHLKNFGVTGNRVVLIDSGGLTNRWCEVKDRLDFEQRANAPHVRLGLGKTLASRPDIAERFNARWKETVSVEGVLRHWPEMAIPQEH